MSDLQDLLERVEKATEPDRELDAALVVTFDQRPQIYAKDSERLVAYALRGPKQRKEMVSVGVGGRGIVVPSYTASIDASLEMVEKVLPVWGYSVEREASDYFSACLMKPGAPQVVSAPGKTGALAILAALLRAKIAEDTP